MSGHHHAPQRAPTQSESVRGVDSETEKTQLKLLLLLSCLKCQMIPVISPTPFNACCLCRRIVHTLAQLAKRKSSFQNLFPGEKMHFTYFVHKSNSKH